MPTDPRYDIREGDLGWTVIDTTTGGPVVLDSFVQIGLSAADADDLADALNAIERQRTDASIQ